MIDYHGTGWPHEGRQANRDTNSANINLPRKTPTCDLCGDPIEDEGVHITPEPTGEAKDLGYTRDEVLESFRRAAETKTGDEARLAERVVAHGEATVHPWCNPLTQEDPEP